MTPVRWIEHDQCTSTQLEAKKLSVDLSADEPFVVTCRQQTAGRGRGDHTWTQVDVAFLFTLGIPKKLWPLPHATWLPLNCAYFSRKILADLSSGIRLVTKWPNDLGHVEDDREFKKVGGILVESTDLHWLVGMGINLFSEESSFTGIFQRQADAMEFDRKNFVHLFYEKLSTGAKSPRLGLEFWEHAWIKPGDTITYQDNGLGSEPVTAHSATVVGIGDHGELIVQVAGGELKKLFSADVKRVRMGEDSVYGLPELCPPR